MSESLNQTTNQDVVQKDVKKKVIPRQDKPPENDTGLWKFNRRSFLTLTGWLGFLGFIFTSIIGA